MPIDPSVFEQSEIDLSVENLHAEDARTFAEELATNTTMHSVDFGYNELGPGGAVPFAEALKTNETLRKLSMDNCQLDESDARSFIDSIKINTSLQSLILNLNNFNDHNLVTELADMLADNHTLLERQGFESLNYPEKLEIPLKRNQRLTRNQAETHDDPNASGSMTL